jgi:hypothetical protein
LFVYDIAIPKQEVSAAYVEFNDNAVSDHFEDMFDLGIEPINCGRIWIHTHPAGLARPSRKDEETFERVFGRCDWAVMFILPKDHGHYCRVNFNTPIKHSVEIQYEIEYNCTFEGSKTSTWEEEYKDNVEKKVYATKMEKPSAIGEYFKRKALGNKEQRLFAWDDYEKDDDFSWNKQEKKTSLYEKEDLDFEVDVRVEDVYKFSAPKPVKKGKVDVKKNKSKR